MLNWPGVGVDPLLQGLNGGGEGLPEGPEHPRVHLEPRQLHLRQHPAQGVLHVKYSASTCRSVQLGDHLP